MWGCPVKPVVATGCGSSRLMNTRDACRIFQANWVSAALYWFLGLKFLPIRACSSFPDISPARRYGESVPHPMPINADLALLNISIRTASRKIDNFFFCNFLAGCAMVWNASHDTPLSRTELDHTVLRRSRGAPRPSASFAHKSAGIRHRLGGNFCRRWVQGRNCRNIGGDAC